MQKTYGNREVKAIPNRATHGNGQMVMVNGSLVRQTSPIKPKKIGVQAVRQKLFTRYSKPKGAKQMPKG